MTKAALATILVIGAHMVGGVQQETLDFTFSVSPEVSLNEPVILRYLVRNQSGRIVAPNLGYDRIGAMTFRLTRPDGTTQTVTPQYRDGASQLETVTLGPSERYQQQVVLNEWLDFRQVGNYVLSVAFARLAVPVKDQLGAPTAIYVRTRDEAHLRNRCTFFLSTLQAERDEVKRKEIVEAFVALQDPVAIPFWEQAASVTWSDKFTSALLKLASPAARDALVRLSTSSNPDLAFNARETLKMFRVR